MADCFQLLQDLGSMKMIRDRTGLFFFFFSTFSRLRSVYPKILHILGLCLHPRSFADCLLGQSNLGYVWEVTATHAVAVEVVHCEGFALDVGLGCSRISPPVADIRACLAPASVLFDQQAQLGDKLAGGMEMRVRGQGVERMPAEVRGMHTAAL